MGYCGKDEQTRRCHLSFLRGEISPKSSPNLRASTKLKQLQSKAYHQSPLTAYVVVLYFA
jgi:hypothetical protein